MAFRASTALFITLLFITSSRANADLRCFDEFKEETLSHIGEQPPIDPIDEHNQKRFNAIFPEAFSVAEPAEKIELMHTFDLLELQNAKKSILSPEENSFIVAYQAFTKKGRPVRPVHDYFRAIARRDFDQAKLIGEEILSDFNPDKRDLMSKLTGILPSDSPEWNRMTTLPEVKTSLIDYNDHNNVDVKGVKVDVDRAFGERKSKLEKLASEMEDLHDVTITSVPPAIEKLHSTGFSTRAASYTNLEKRGSESVSRPLIVVPQHDIEFDRISYTTRHEARHAWFATRRKQGASSPFDGYFRANEGKFIGESGGYSKFQSLEELSTHPKDLIESFRTGNAEILRLYKLNKTLPANKVIDIPYLESKALTVRNLSDQSVKGCDETIAELERRATEPLTRFGIMEAHPYAEGYEVSFPVNDNYWTTLYFSDKEDRKKVNFFIKEFMEYQDAANLALAEAKMPDELITERAKKAYAQFAEMAKAKLAQTREIAEKTGKDARGILSLVDRFHEGELKALTREDYLEARRLITKPSSRITGVMKRDSEQIQNAVAEIRAKRALRNPDQKLSDEPSKKKRYFKYKGKDE